MAHGDITDVPGILVGHAQNFQTKTGVTVVLAPRAGVAAGLHMGGNACSTRQFDALGPLHIVERIHAVCLCGGSAFGLDAGGGVLAWLEEQRVGYHVVGAIVPIVPTAALFDLNFGDGSTRPDAAMGRLACMHASAGPVPEGSVGVGTGASVGKLFGIGQGMKGGVGSSSEISGELVVGVLVAVNAYGDVTDTEGNLLAGARTAADSLDLADAARLLKEGKARSRTTTGSGDKPESPDKSAPAQNNGTHTSTEHTTLAVIATNARMDRMVASRTAAQASLGLGRVIRPFHSHIDGDLTVLLSCGDVDADPNRVGLLAAEALQQAVIRAVRDADGFGIIPAARDLPLSGSHEGLPGETLLKKGCPPDPLPKTFETSGGSNHVAGSRDVGR
ncbi:MAG: P1 family peptidase [Thermodesulfobacteriota bacterium]